MVDYRSEIDRKGLKHVWIAKQIKISKTLFSLFLSGKKNLTPETLHELNNILNINVN